MSDQSVGIIMAVIVFIISIIILCGKGKYLIAGFNTASARERKEYNNVRLKTVVGLGMMIISILLFVVSFLTLPPYLINLIVSLILAVLFGMVILANTICKNK